MQLAFAAQQPEIAQRHQGIRATGMCCRPKKHKGIKPISWGLPLCQDPGLAGLAAIPDADLDSIHVIQWERYIIWDDADDLDESSVKLRDDAQNGAATGIEEDEWDDLDRALEMGNDSPRAKHSRHQLPMPTLEPLPQKPAKGISHPMFV